MALRGLVALLFLVVACGDAQSGDPFNGTGGNAGTGGVGGDGGSGGVGSTAGEGGAGGISEPVRCGTDEDCDSGLVCTHKQDEDDFCESVGALQECDVVEEGTISSPNPETGELEPVIYYHHEWAHIPTTPGDVLEITVCDEYWVEDGVQVPDRIRTGCRTFEVVAPDDVLEQNCTQSYDASDPPPFAVDSVPYETLEIGWKRVYVKRS